MEAFRWHIGQEENHTGIFIPGGDHVIAQVVISPRFIGEGVNILFSALLMTHGGWLKTEAIGIRVTAMCR